MLGRGVEHAVMRWLAAEAARGGVERVRMAFERTRKNAPAEQFLRDCAERADAGRQSSDGCSMIQPAPRKTALDFISVR